MARLKTADTPNGFLIQLQVADYDIAWNLGGKRLRRAYWKALAEKALSIKHKEILKGLDKDGQPLQRLSKTTIQNRQSHTGSAYRYAPVFIPSYSESRTYQFLRYDVRPDGVWFFWKHDPKTGSSWGDILRYHADGRSRGSNKIRDVFGISPVGMARLERLMHQWFETNKSRYLKRDDRQILEDMRRSRQQGSIQRKIEIFNRKLAKEPKRVSVSIRSGIVSGIPNQPITDLRGFRQKRK